MCPKSRCRCPRMSASAYGSLIEVLPVQIPARFHHCDDAGPAGYNREAVVQEYGQPSGTDTAALPQNHVLGSWEEGDCGQFRCLPVLAGGFGLAPGVSSVPPRSARSFIGKLRPFLL